MMNTDAYAFLKIANPLCAWATYRGALVCAPNAPPGFGNITGWLREEDDYVALRYLMDMREADDPAFLAKLDRYRKDGHPVNHADLHEQMSKGTFGETLDMRPYEFRLKAEMPF